MRNAIEIFGLKKKFGWVLAWVIWVGICRALISSCETVQYALHHQHFNVFAAVVALDETCLHVCIKTGHAALTNLRSKLSSCVRKS